MQGHIRFYISWLLFVINELLHFFFIYLVGDRFLYTIFYTTANTIVNKTHNFEASGQLSTSLLGYLAPMVTWQWL